MLVDGVPISTVGGIGGLLILLFIMLANGRLFTRSQHDDAIHDRDEWRAESRLKDAQIAEKDEQLRQLAEVGRAVNAVMRAIQKGSTSDHEVPQ